MEKLRAQARLVPDCASAGIAPRGIHAVELEARMLMSASPVALVVEDLPDPLDAHIADIGQQAPAPQASAVATDQDSTNEVGLEGPNSLETSFELVFIDEGVDDYEPLVADLVGQESSDREFQIVLLDADRDGIEQISETLRQYEDVDAVHLVSHGMSGQVKLGATWLSENNVAAYAGEIASWQDALSSDADLLFYGCDLAGNVTGQELIASLGALTGADVAASTDDTGHASYGGDWDLELAFGSVDTQIAFSVEVQQNWLGLLDYVEQFQTFSPTTPGSWEVVDLSGGPFNVPDHAVLEIAISSSDASASQTGGVRAVGSALNRTLELHQADNNSRDYVVMHVQADASGQIETFASDTAEIQFTLLGYWDSGTYVETVGVVTAGPDAAWHDRNLSGFGVVPDSVVEVVLANTHDSEGREAGVRTNNSTLSRIVDLHDSAGSTDVDTTTMFVQAGSTGNARIEIYAEVAADIEFHIMGYWSDAPGTYTELAAINVGSPGADGVWDVADLGLSGVPGDAIAEFTLANDQGGASDNEMGVRVTGSSLSRHTGPQRQIRRGRRRRRPRPNARQRGLQLRDRVFPHRRQRLVQLFADRLLAARRHCHRLGFHWRVGRTSERS